MTGFYSHRKTVRLFAKLGNDAFWLPPRIWAYSAENQPDGNLSGYQPEELAMLVGYKGHATSMLQALKDCGFIEEDGTIHDWKEHNGYHEKFSVRAKTAAKARWSKVSPQTPFPKKEKVESGDKHCLEHATSISHFDYLKSEISQFYERAGHWTHFEESSLADITRSRTDCKKEYSSIIEYHASIPSKDKRFFPRSIEALLSGWTKTLDAAATAKRLSDSVLPKPSLLTSKEAAALAAKEVRELEKLQIHKANAD